MENKWRQCEWGDIATLEYGKSLRNYRTKAGQYRVYGTNGPIGWYNESLCTHPGVIVGRKGAYRGIHYSPEPFFVIDTAFYLEPKQKMDLRWAYYCLLTYDINGMDSGSAIPSTSRESFYRLPVRVPPLPEQHAIAHILGTLDDKIELNRRMNHTLETMAQTLFKNWFMDFEPFRDQGMQDSPLGEIPVGWRVGKLDEIARFVKGVSYRSDDLQESHVALVTLKSIARGGGYYPSGLKPYIGEYDSEQALSPGEVVVAHTDLTQKAEVIGRAARVQIHPKIQTLVASLDLVVVRPKIKEASNEFLYGLLSRPEFQEHAYGYANGTTVLHLSTKALPQYQHVLPPPDVMNEFTKIAKPIYGVFDGNEIQRSTLTEIRDTLLPKLLSGKIRIRNAEKLMERVV